MELRQIASFQVDHTKLLEGMYTSRVDGDVTTYDIRMTRPNQGVYLEHAAAHTIEHIFATYVRSGPLSEQVLYVGPMGCRTGFYLLVRNMAQADAIALVQASMDFIAGFEGAIPGATVGECGNYRDQDLPGAKTWGAKMRDVLKDWTPEKLRYQS